MFKLKFFILFVLAALCFGHASPIETSSGNGEGEGKSPGAGETSEDEVSSGGGSGSGPEEKNVETKSPEGVGENGGTSPGTNKETLVLLNNSVPEFVGSYERKKELLSTFIASCNTKRMDVTSVESKTLANKETATNSSPAISLISLYLLTTDTFLCKPPNNGPTFLMPMPNGTLL
uniref:Putative secreted salivary gland peptide n=1 Tax=Ixodes ricinus TaxID=34613 RepID=A0A090X7Z3_IXORI